MQPEAGQEGMRAPRQSKGVGLTRIAAAGATKWFANETQATEVYAVVIELILDTGTRTEARRVENSNLQLPELRL